MKKQSNFSFCSFVVLINFHSNTKPEMVANTAHLKLNRLLVLILSVAKNLFISRQISEVVVAIQIYYMDIQIVYMAVNRLISKKDYNIISYNYLFNYLYYFVIVFRLYIVLCYNILLSTMGASMFEVVLQAKARIYNFTLC